MKRVDLVKRIEEMGCVFVRHGGKHDWYTNPVTGVSQPVPRHREVGEGLARRILRMLATPGAADPGEAPAGGA